MLMYLVEWLLTRDTVGMKIVNTFMFDGPQSAGTKLIWSVECGVTPWSFPAVSKN